MKSLTLHLNDKNLLENEIQVYCSLWDENRKDILTQRIIIDRTKLYVIIIID